MATQNEAQLWGTLERSVPPTYLVRRVEARHPPGISDVFWSTKKPGLPAVSGWLELKDEELEVRPEQGIFLRSMWRAGVPSAVLIRKAGLLYLYPGDIPMNNRLPITLAKGVFPSQRFDSHELWATIAAQAKKD